MASVTKRIKEIKQPRNGYLPVAMFERIELDCTPLVNANFEGNIHGSIIGMTVDYLTRFMLTGDKSSAFRISLGGSRLAKREAEANELLSHINGLDSESICSACKLVRYDSFARNILMAKQYFNERPEPPNDETITYIRSMVQCAQSLFLQHGPVVSVGMTFENGYTDVIDSGDADFITTDTLWDFKTTKKEQPTSYDTLQLLVYYIMGLHSTHCAIYERIKYLCIFNPRHNVIYRCDIARIPKETIKTVETTVICYGSEWQQLREEDRAAIYQRAKSGEMLSSNEASILLRTSTKCISLLTRNGWLPSVKQGRTNLFAPSELLKWCDEEKVRYTLDEWLLEGTTRFGKDMDHWKFQCPHCHQVYSLSTYPRVIDSVKLFTVAAKKCINWHNVNKKTNDHECTYQYFKFNEKIEMAKGGVIIEINGKEHHFFSFAE